jgi:hypothetical protein
VSLWLSFPFHLTPSRAAAAVTVVVEAVEAVEAAAATAVAVAVDP